MNQTLFAVDTSCTVIFGDDSACVAGMIGILRSVGPRGRKDFNAEGKTNGGSNNDSYLARNLRFRTSPVDPHRGYGEGVEGESVRRFLGRNP